MLRLLLVTLLVASCAKHTPEKASVAKVPVKLDVKLIQALELKNHTTKSDTFTFFWFPEKGSMNWDSPIFDRNDSELEKLSDIIAQVIKMSDKIDAADLASYKLLQRNKEIEKLMAAKDCETNFEDEECIAWSEESMNNVMEMGRLSSEEKGKHLRGLQEAIDDVNFIQIDETTYDKVGNVENWFDYGDANEYEFTLFQEDKFLPNIVLPTLGNPAQRYSSANGDIYDIKYVKSEYAPNTMMLKFMVKEKAADGSYTGNIWEADLEKSNFAGKIRFSGDVFRLNPQGNTIQQGIMKFELPVNDFVGGDDDWGDDDFGDDFGDDFDF
jgi:hypothetical protein